MRYNSRPGGKVEYAYDIAFSNTTDWLKCLYHAFTISTVFPGLETLRYDRDSAVVFSGVFSA